MPNWNENFVTIQAPVSEVMQYLVEDDEEEGSYRFNMHRLFPERFCECDPTWEKTWDYDWATDNTGSKWFPKLSLINQWEATELIYNTAREPNNLTLARLHEHTGWTTINAYEEPGMAFAWDFICRDGECRNEPRVYKRPCDRCERRFTWEELKTVGDFDEVLCNQCQEQEGY